MSDFNLVDNTAGPDKIIADPAFGSDQTLFPLFIDVENMPYAADLPVGSGSTNVCTDLVIYLLLFCIIDLFI